MTKTKKSKFQPEIKGKYYSATVWEAKTKKKEALYCFLDKDSGIYGQYALSEKDAVTLVNLLDTAFEEGKRYVTGDKYQNEMLKALGKQEILEQIKEIVNKYE